MAVSYTLKLNRAEIKRMLESPGGLVGVFITQLGTRVMAEAKGNAPVKSGKLRASISMQRGVPGFPTGVEVIINVPYALSVHEGSRGGTITPKSGRMLRFPNKAGVMVYAPRVQQRPRAGNPFLWNALRDAVAQLT